MPSHPSRFPSRAVTISLAGLLALSCTKKDDDGGASAGAAPAAPTATAPAATAPADTAAPSNAPPAAPPATPPAAAIPVPAAEAFAAKPERLADFTEVVPLAGGKAHLAAVATDASDGVLRVLVDGARSDVLAYRTGDCAAGAVVELEPRPDGTVLFRFGQDSYSGCDEENEDNPKADIDSHVDCVELHWDDAARAVVKGRQAKADYTRKLPDWCQSE